MKANYSSSRVATLLFLGYLTVSIFYIFSHLGKTKRKEPIPVNPVDIAQNFEGSTSTTHDRQNVEVSATTSRTGILWVDDKGSSVSLSPNYIDSKLFSGSMKPSQLQPYFYKMETVPSPEEITVATVITPDRFAVFKKLVNNYRGPISVTLHVAKDENLINVLHQLEIFHKSNPLIRKYVDLHLIIDNFERQFNYWRNVARFFSRTDYFLFLDVDFYLCTDFRNSLSKYPEVLSRLRQGEVAVVLPAFEYKGVDEGRDAAVFPRTKSELVNLVKEEKITMFHESWPRGHSSTNYTHWYEATYAYPVTEYVFSYEPYVIAKKDGVPWCDERFIGYGGNKAACLFEIYISGVDYWVLPNDFIIHQTHDYPENTRKQERKFNKKIFDNFRYETCFTYFRTFLFLNQWDTPKAENLKKVCSEMFPKFLEEIKEFDV